MNSKRFGLYLAAVFLLGLLFGLMIEGHWFKEEKTLPEDLKEQLKRFTFVNRNMNLTLIQYRVLGVTIGTYEVGGTKFETFVIGFEDRPGGASADLDYLDLIIEIKRRVDDRQFVIRIVQLGLDTIDVFLDNNFMGSVKPAMEFEVRF
ncbi:MAG: hypothetical protein ACUVQ8_08840 [Nitrososphaeria archaeon]